MRLLRKPGNSIIHILQYGWVHHGLRTVTQIRTTAGQPGGGSNRRIILMGLDQRADQK